MSGTNPLSADLDEILRLVPSEVWEDFRSARLFVTGGTGFFGKWLLEAWVRANASMGLGARAVVLTRDPERFSSEFPHLADPSSVELLRGDVVDFELLSVAPTHIFHAATPTARRLSPEDPAGMRDTIVRGTARVLELARRSGRPKTLFTSSGAIYGTQPPTVERVPEDQAPQASSTPESAYAQGKREAEELCADAAARGIPCAIARCFAFAGPHLPLDGPYAFGNFLRDALGGGPVKVSGDGTALRSYLYASDLVVWLLTILARGKPGRAYNVGSDRPIPIGELARRIAERFGCGYEIAGRAAAGAAPARYVPSIDRARNELGLDVRVPLDEAIDRTARFLIATRPGRMERK